MTPTEKQTEYYMDGKDKWEIHHTVSTDTKINPGDYKEITQITKNGTVVGQMTQHKNKNGENKMEAHTEGIQEVPSTAKRVKK